MSTITTLVNWYGGKQKLAREIISMMPEHAHYVEVFFGSGAVFFNKPRAAANTINDLNENLINLYIQVRDNYDELCRLTYWTLHNRRDYERFVRMHESGYKDVDPVTRAFAFFFLIKTSFQGIAGQGWHPSKTRNSAVFNHNLLENLKYIRKLLDGVVIENDTFQNVIPKYSHPSYLLYCDPPYFGTGEQMYYEHELSRAMHEELHYLLMKSKSMWILSYDDNEFIVNLYKDFFIRRTKITYNTAGRNKSTTELIITNFKPAAPQMDIFDAAHESEELSEEELARIAEKHKEPPVKLEEDLRQWRNDESDQSSQPSLFGS